MEPTWDGRTVPVSIALVSLLAAAHRVVVDDRTQGVSATQTRARVNALLLRPACLCLRTVGVGGTLWPAAGDRVTLGEALKTLADRDSFTVVVIIPSNALGVRSARRWIARISFNRILWWLGDWNWRADGEWVAFESLWTIAHGHVVLCTTLRTEATDARARIRALVALTGLGLDAVTVDHTFWLACLIRVAKVLW